MSDLQQSSNVTTERTTVISPTFAQEQVKALDLGTNDTEALKIMGTIQALEQITDTVSSDTTIEEQEGTLSSSSNYALSANYDGGNGDGNGDDGDTTTTTTDADGNTVTTVTDKNGNTTVTTSDPNDNVISVVTTTTDPTTGTVTVVNSTYGYTTTSVTTTDKNGNTKTVTTDPYGNTISTVETSTNKTTGAVTVTTSDACGNSTSTTTNTDGSSETTTITKDNNATITVTTDKDKNGTVTSTTTTTETQTTDADGNVIATTKTVTATDAKGTSTTTTVTDAEGYVTETVTGKPVTTTDKDGNTTTTQTTKVVTVDEDGNVIGTTETTTTTTKDKATGNTTVATDTITTDAEGHYTETSTSVTTDKDGKIVDNSTDVEIENNSLGFSTTTYGHYAMGGNSVGVAIASLNHAQDMLLQTDLDWLQQNRLAFSFGTTKALEEMDMMIDSAQDQKEAGYYEAYGLFASGAAAGVGVGATLASSRAALNTVKTENANITQQRRTLDMLEKSKTSDGGLIVSDSPVAQRRSDAQIERHKAIRAAVTSDNNQTEIASRADYPVEVNGQPSKYITGPNGRVRFQGDGSDDAGSNIGSDGFLKRADGNNETYTAEDVEAYNRSGAGERGALNEFPAVGEPVQGVDQNGNALNRNGTKIPGKFVRYVTHDEVNHFTRPGERATQQHFDARPETVDGEGWHIPGSRQANQWSEYRGKRAPDIIERQDTSTRIVDGTRNFFHNRAPGRVDAATPKPMRLNYKNEEVADAFSSNSLAASGEDAAFTTRFKAKMQEDLKTSTAARDRAMGEFNANVQWYNMICTAMGGNILQGEFKILSSDKAYDAQTEAALSKYLGQTANQLFSAASNWQGQASKAYDQSLSVLSGPLDALRRAVSRG